MRGHEPGEGKEPSVTFDVRGLQTGTELAEMLDLDPDQISTRGIQVEFSDGRARVSWEGILVFKSEEWNALVQSHQARKAFAKAFNERGK